MNKMVDIEFLSIETMSFEDILKSYFKYKSDYNSAFFRYLQFVTSTLLNQKHTYNIIINFTFI